MTAYLFIDIDNFGDINKKFGFGYGNKLISRFKKHVRSNFGINGTVFHFGADNFLVEYKGARDYDELDEKLIAFLKQQFIYHANKHMPISITSSIGVAVSKDHAEEFWELVRCADVALQEAKESGKNTYKVYTKNVDDLTKLKFDLSQSIKKSIEANEFEMVYQPIISAVNDQIVGAEALVRWNHKSKGQIPPNDFIEIAENTGQMALLETWIIKETVRHMKTLLEKIPSLGFVSINLSNKGLKNNHLIELLDTLQSKAPFDASKLILERTESYLIEDFDACLVEMEAIIEKGYRFALDDFGTGYSSLSYLMKLPVSKLKLDRSFVHRIESSNRDQTMIKTIIDLAHNLNLKIVVEGVERKEQVELLKQMGCDYFQGYYFSKPKSYNTFMTKFR